MKWYESKILKILATLERRGYQTEAPGVYNFILMVLYPSETPSKHIKSMLLYARLVWRSHLARVAKKSELNKDNPWFN